MMQKYKVVSFIDGKQYQTIDMWFENDTPEEELEAIMWDWATAHIDVGYEIVEGAKLN